MSEVKYIAETRTFVIDGKIIKESELPQDKAAELKKMAENWQVILDDDRITGRLLA